MPSPRLAIFDRQDTAGNVVSAEEIERQRLMAEALAGQAAATPEIASPWQGLNYLAQVGLSGALAKKASRGEEQRRQAYADALGGAVDVSATGMTPEQFAQINALDPSFGASILQAQMQSRMAALSTPEWEDATGPNGVLGQRNLQTGQFEPYPDYVQAGSGGGGPDLPATQELWDEETQSMQLFALNPETNTYDIRLGRTGAPEAEGPPETKEFWNEELGVMELRGFNPETDQFDIPMGQTNAPESDTPAFGDENALRTQFNALTSDYRVIDNSYRQIQVLAQSSTGAGDMALIFSFMKMLDPTSTVREGEYANAKNTAGIEDTLRNLYNQAIDGQFLSPDQRADFAQQAENLYQSASTRYDQTATNFRELAQAYGMDPDRIVMPFAPMSTAPAAGAPAAGDAAEGQMVREGGVIELEDGTRLQNVGGQWVPYDGE